MSVVREGKALSQAESKVVSEPAMLLGGTELATPGHNLKKLLHFFGISLQAINSAELQGWASDNDAASKPRLFCSADEFVPLLTAAPSAVHRLHSVFVYGGAERSALQQIIQLLVDDANLPKIGSAQQPATLHVAHDPEFCGAMSGVRIPLASALVVGIADVQSRFTPIISTDEAIVFLRADWQGVPVFISPSPGIVDLDAELERGIFDIRQHALTTLPAVLYVNWAFVSTRWQPPEASACIVIDDPLLRPRHGFVEFDKLLALMKQHRFSTNVAFIPWNSLRNHAATVKLFRDNADYFSVSIHGSDHTHAEFGSTDRQLLYAKSRQALQRMAAHETKTGIQHDRVMIFPHGALSRAALMALKRTEFIASAGSETISTDSLPRPIRIADVWNTAVTCYSGFPIFTRRGPQDGIENAAFDILIGKPAIISIHHDFCRDHCRDLTAFVNSLNALSCSLHWRNLSELIRRSFRQREISPGLVEVEIAASEFRLTNTSERHCRYSVSKREPDPASVDRIEAGSRLLTWKTAGDRLCFEVELDPGETTLIGVRFSPLPGNFAVPNGFPYRVQTLLRRHACELRDNYLVTDKVILPAKLKRFIAKETEATPGPAFPTTKQQPAAPDESLSLRGDVRNGLAELPAQRISATMTNFTRWLDRYGETSWDHQSFFAGPIGSRAKALYYRRRALGTAAVAPMIFSEAFLPAARRFFHHRIRLPIADAHYAMGFSFLYEATHDPTHFDRAIHFLDELEQSRCGGFTDYCWGYPFDWVTRGGTIPRGTPLVTSTPYAYEAFLQAYEIEPRPHWKEILGSIAQHAARDIKSFPTSAKGSSASYTPFDSGGVINAAAYRGFLLTSASQILERDDYRAIAERNRRFVLETQNADGSWYYATDGVRDFVDHFHTCFVLKALAKIDRLIPCRDTDEALEKGMAYYLRSLFDEEGLPKPFAKAPRLTVYKQELYDFAECINLCLLLRDRFPRLNDTLERVVERVLNGWVKGDGSFRSRRLHLAWDNVPMHRWGQSQMFRSLACYLWESSIAQGESTE